MGEQRPNVEAPGSHHIENRLEVSLFGPADEADGIIMPARFVSRIVATGTIGARNLEGQFLLVEV
ncbi:hypothetical protein D3C72_2551330 [compost metagenome]